MDEEQRRIKAKIRKLMDRLGCSPSQALDLLEPIERRMAMDAIEARRDLLAGCDLAHDASAYAEMEISWRPQ